MTSLSLKIRKIIYILTGAKISVYRNCGEDIEYLSEYRIYVSQSVPVTVFTLIISVRLYKWEVDVKETMGKTGSV